MNRNPAYRPSRRPVSYKRKRPVQSYVLRKKPRYAMVTQSQGSLPSVKSRASVRSIVTSAIPRPWSRKDFGQNDPSVNVCTYVTHQAGWPTQAFLDTRTLDGVEITSMLGRTTTAAVNLRRTNCIHVLGIKLFLDVFNQVDQVINFEYAVVSPKNGATVDAVNFLTADGLLQRGQTVDSKSSLDLKAAKVNSDENFIFSHKRQQLLHLPPSAGGHTDYNANIKYGASFKQGYEWIPINRKIAYDSMTSAGSSDPIFLSFWCYGTRELAAAAKVSNAVLYQFKAVLLYKNVET